MVDNIHRAICFANSWILPFSFSQKFIYFVFSHPRTPYLLCFVFCFFLFFKVHSGINLQLGCRAWRLINAIFALKLGSLGNIRIDGIWPKPAGYKELSRGFEAIRSGGIFWINNSSNYSVRLSMVWRIMPQIEHDIRKPNKIVIIHKK